MSKSNQRTSQLESLFESSTRDLLVVVWATCIVCGVELHYPNMWHCSCVGMAMIGLGKDAPRGRKQVFYVVDRRCLHATDSYIIYSKRCVIGANCRGLDERNTSIEGEAVGVIAPRSKD